MLNFGKIKGQISMFVVISIILVIVGIFLFSVTSNDLFYSPEDRIIGQITEGVESCVDLTLRQGAFLIGFQGGRIDVPLSLSADPNSYLSFGDDEAFKIVNWDSERRIDSIPTIDGMEVELENYVEENSQICIEGKFLAMKDFLNLEYDFNLIDVDVTINLDNVAADIIFPVEFSEINGDISSNLQDFYLDLDDVKIGSLYNLAVEIFNLEENDEIFEALVLDQIYSASDYSDRYASMPTEGMSFSCAPQIWTYDILKENLANLNNNNFKYLYFDGTYPIDYRFDYNLGDDEDNLGEYFRKNYVFNLEDKKSFKDFEVEVVMPTSQITGADGYFDRFPFREFEVTPSSGQVVKPIQMKVDSGFKIPVPCVQVYHHLYSLDYDLLVKLVDKSDDSSSYFFQFPVRVEVESNEPKKKTPSLITNLNVPTATNNEFCADDNRDYFSRIYVEDKSTGDFLSGADVSFNCLSLSCSLGDTQKPRYEFVDLVRPDSIPVLETNIGYCQGGKLEVKKEGYFQIDQEPSRIDIDVEKNLDEDDRMTLTAYMVPTKTFPVNVDTVSAINYNTCETGVLDSDIQFYIVFENEALDFSSEGFYPVENPGFLDSIELLDYEDASYNVSVFVMETSDERDELRGILDIENLKLDVNDGNFLQIVVPVLEEELNGDNFIEYFENTKTLVENSALGCSIYGGFGVTIR